MKLRSLLLGIMITGVFVACSDNDEVPGKDPVTNDSATLSVQIANVQTKSLGDTEVDDKMTLLLRQSDMPSRKRAALLRN